VAPSAPRFAVQHGFLRVLLTGNGISAGLSVLVPLEFGKWGRAALPLARTRGRKNA
jgi:hypothetical protein